MKQFPFFLPLFSYAAVASAMFLLQVASGQDKPIKKDAPFFNTPDLSELSKLSLNYGVVVKKRVIIPFEAKREKLNKSFQAAIEKKIASATSAGKLSPIVGLRALKVSFEADGNVPVADPQDAPPAVVQLSGVYRKERAKLDTAEEASLASMAELYHKALNDLEVRLVKERRVGDAIKVKQVREEFEKDKAALLRGAGESIASREPGHGKKVPVAPGRSRKGGKVIVHCTVGEMPATPPPFASVPEHLDDVVFLTGPNHSGPNNLDSAAGFILAVRSNGSVVAWGNPELGVIKGLPKDLTGVVEVAGSWNQGAARTADGKVTLWDEERSWDYKGDEKFKQVCQYDHSSIVGVTEDGEVLSLTEASRKLAIPEAIQGKVKLLRNCQKSHFAILENGSLYHWGDMRNGVGSFPKDLKDVVDVYLLKNGKGGGCLVMALLRDGSIKVWGKDTSNLKTTRFRKATALPQYGIQHEQLYQGPGLYRVGDDQWKNLRNESVKWPRGCTQIIGWREFCFGIKPD